MSQASDLQPEPTDHSPAEIPDRLCTWCKIPMMKRLVAEGAFIHYTCPKCIFQHTMKRKAPEASQPPNPR